MHWHCSINDIFKSEEFNIVFLTNSIKKKMVKGCLAAKDHIFSIVIHLIFIT